MSLPDPCSLTRAKLWQTYNETLEAYEKALDKESLGWHNCREVRDLERWLCLAKRLLGLK